MALFETISRLYKDNESYQQHVQNALFMSHRPGVSDYGSHCLSVSTSSWPPVAPGLTFLSSRRNPLFECEGRTAVLKPFSSVACRLNGCPELTI